MLADTRLWVIAVRPPLSCRTSPPQGGRSNVTSAFTNRQCCKRDRREPPILPGPWEDRAPLNPHYSADNK
ncbi:MAG: hypothetical protein E5Y02_20100 [Mesorhizobium sp.]|nr:MAG: hypothetical protein E5Y02_20100 [Mesorhizobium sp.]